MIQILRGELPDMFARAASGEPSPVALGPAHASLMAKMDGLANTSVDRDLEAAPTHEIG